MNPLITMSLNSLTAADITNQSSNQTSRCTLTGRSIKGKASKYSEKILNIPSTNCFSLIQNKSVQNSSKMQLVIALHFFMKS